MFRAYKYHPSVIGYRHASHGRGASSERFNNDLGQLTDVTETRGGLTFTTAYTYDLAGNVLTITLDSGRVITYSRNANGLVSGVSGTVSGSGTVQFSSAVNYLPFGPVSGMTYGNGLTFSATYDQDYNPTNRTVSGGIYNHTYDTDDVGNIIQIGTPTFGYDALNRLNAETPGSVSYTYDATSNRLTKVSGGTTTSTVPSTSNKVSAVGGTSIVYNSAGAFTSYGSTAYNWNATGQISFISTSGSTVGTYTYNASNQRTKKVAGGNTVHYVYGLGGLLYGEYDGSGNLIREYVYQNNAPLAQIDAGSPEVLTYLHTDHLGTPKYGTNSGGTSVWAANTDPFGVGTPSGSRTVNLRMAGQYYDSESGLFYNWNRYYHPALGRYISSDPIGLEGGPNTFNYASVSPVMFTDPEGLEVFPDEKMGPLRFGDTWESQTKNYPDAQIYESQGKRFLAPRNTDWCKVNCAGQKRNAYSPLAVLEVEKNISHYGTFDFQRSGGKYHPEYIDASNYAVGVYMQGAKFGKGDLFVLGQTYSHLFSSNAGDPKQSQWWNNGYDDAQSGLLSGCTRHFNADQ